MHNAYMQAIQRFEGFQTRAQWDYAQNTNGYGTKAHYAGEEISEPEAQRRFAAEIAQARLFVERHSAGWDDGTKAALTSLTFNAGTRWAADGLGDAVRAKDIAAVKEKFLAYTKAGGVDLPGLVKRRLEEVAWIGNPQAVEAPAAALAAHSHRGSPPTAETTAVQTADAVPIDYGQLAAAAPTAAMQQQTQAPASPMPSIESQAREALAHSLMMLLLELKLDAR
ncbi:MAG: lysozyme [Hyphomicrobiaceae bacterium]